MTAALIISGPRPQAWASARARSPSSGPAVSSAVKEAEACQGPTSHSLDTVDHPNGHCCPCLQSSPGNSIARLFCHQGEGSSTPDTKGGGLKVSAFQSQPQVRPHPTLKATATEITPGPRRARSSDLEVEVGKHRPPALPVFPGPGLSPRGSVPGAQSQGLSQLALTFSPHFSSEPPQHQPCFPAATEGSELSWANGTPDSPPFSACLHSDSP